MDSDQWKLASLQTLEYLQRLGVKHLPKPSAKLSEILADWVDVSSKGSSGTSIASSRTQLPSPESRQPASQVPKKPVQAQVQAQAPSPSAMGPASRSVAKPSWPPVESPWMTPVRSAQDRSEALGQLKLKVEACRLCKDIVCHRRQTVFGVGPVTTRFVMIGDAPGPEEDRLGEPFVGASGELFDKILRATGIPRDQVYILNTLKCRPPNNRVPSDIELDNCRPFIEAQLEILQPEYIICWGATAVRAVLQTTESIGRLRGRFHCYKKAKVLVTYHPTYLERAPEAKKLTWEDMQMLMRELGTLKA
ncbi:MAG: uracil-DNA glycosylase [Pirellula sp.]